MTTLFSLKATENGKIEQVSFYNGVHEEEVEGILISEAEYNEVFPNTDLYYYSNGIVKKPPKPNGEYTFDYSTKQWVFDYDVAVTKALAERDRLLADGPDRISPLWWSSMTTQEQLAWTQYRQDLLDITNQADYPEFIVWPIKP